MLQFPVWECQRQALQTIAEYKLSCTDDDVNEEEDAAEIDEDEDVRPKKTSEDEDDVGDSTLGVVEDPEDSPVSGALF